MVLGDQCLPSDSDNRLLVCLEEILIKDKEEEGMYTFKTFEGEKGLFGAGWEFEEEEYKAADEEHRGGGGPL